MNKKKNKKTIKPSKTVNKAFTVPLVVVMGGINYCPECGFDIRELVGKIGGIGEKK